MTNREREILNLIRQNPLISQKELAEELSITRSSVAVHITNLLKKGYIVGKGYILSDDSYVCVIGGSNMDIQGFPNSKLINKDSNPGSVKISLGGVGRNIAENLVKLGMSTKLLSVVGNDIYGNKILDEARISGMDVENVLVLKDKRTSTYVSILDEKGDMRLAIADMDIIDNMNIDYIRENSHLIKNAKVCVVDTNVPEEVIEYTLTNCKGVDFFLDTVSTTKAKKVKDVIGYFHTIKPNKIEAEILSGIKIKNEDDLKQVGEYFLAKGVKRVFISLGKEGIYYNDGKNQEIIRTPKVKVTNATGAGDAFISGLVYSHVNGLDSKNSAKFAIASSILAISHENTINPNMSYENVYKKMEELELC